MDRCPDDNLWGRFLDGATSAATRRTLEHHLVECEACHDLLVQVANQFSPPPGAVSSPSEPLSVGRGTSIGRYVALELLGRGSMGSVYLAYDPELDRKLALKLLDRPVGDGDRNLRTEARAMARLTSDHVVTVYDTGEHAGYVFIAMEYIAGETLRQWLSQSRTVPQIMRAFGLAAQGLADAHAAGIIHRDFKPDNVMVTLEGNVVVGDFGLATRPIPCALSEASRPHMDIALGGVTADEGTPGTPRYMAPEQLVGQRADARSDQFSLCVALYEALFGRLPFSASDIDTMVARIQGGRLDYAGRRIPRRLQRLLTRGLRFNPDTRHESMRDIARGLAPRRSASKWTLAGVAGALTVVSLLAATTPSASPDCPGLSLQDHWGPTREAAVETALGSAELPYAHDTAQRAVEDLTQYFDGYQRLAQESCALGPGHELALRQAACLAASRHEFAALVEELAAARPSSVRPAIAAIRRLPRLEACELGRLSSTTPRPAHPELEADLARVRVLTRLREKERAVSLAESLVVDAEQADAPWIEAAARYALAGWFDDVDLDRAEAMIRTGLVAAERAQDDALRARGWLRLLRFQASSRGDTNGARAWLPLARILVQQTEDPDLEAILWRVQGTIEYEAKRYAQALSAFEQGLAVAEEGSSSPALGMADAHVYVAMAHTALGHGRAALDHAAAAVELASSVFGEHHPAVVELREQEASALVMNGRYERALEIYGPVLAAYRQTYGEHSLHVAALELSHVSLYGNLGDYAAAELAGRAALEIFESQLGSEHQYTASARTNLAWALINRDAPDEALELVTRNLTLLEASPDPTTDASWVFDLYYSGLAHHRAGRPRAAIPALRRALEKASNDDPATQKVAANIRAVLGDSLLLADQPQDAIAVLEPLLGTWQPTRDSRGGFCTASVSLAIALSRSGEQSRARTVAERERMRCEAWQRENPDEEISAALDNLRAESQADGH